MARPYRAATTLLHTLNTITTHNSNRLRLRGFKTITYAREKQVFTYGKVLIIKKLEWLLIMISDIISFRKLYLMWNSKCIEYLKLNKGWIFFFEWVEGKSCATEYYLPCSEPNDIWNRNRNIEKRSDILQSSQSM